MGIGCGWEKKSLEMTPEMVTLWKLADIELRRHNRRELADGYKIRGSRIWAASIAAVACRGGNFGDDTVKIEDLLAILRG